MDLGDTWQRIDDTFFGGWLPGGNSPWEQGATVGTPGPGGQFVANPGPGGAPLPQPSAPAAGVNLKGFYWDPAANCGAGKWIRKRRKRRRPIITQSECAQISMLQGAVGKGQTMRDILNKRMPC